MFEQVTSAPADPILGLTEAYHSDSRADKVNLGVGVFMNDQGIVPIQESVKEAERRLLEHRHTKSYLPISGHTQYTRLVQTLLLGDAHERIQTQCIQTAQTPGGTGALRVAADFMVQHLGVKTLWMSNPTWANHTNIFTSAGLALQSYAYYDSKQSGLDFEGMIADLAQAKPGDAILLHGCCHNPTGVDPSAEQWQQLAQVIQQRQLLPVFDLAYQGFSQGVEEDAYALRLFVQQFDELLVCNSFSKNFGLYNERIGAFSLIASNAQTASDAFSQVKSIIRANYSNPPAHGAHIVSTVLSDETLKQQWIQEVTHMRQRIKQLRTDLVAHLHRLGASKDFSFIIQQQGMFSYSGLTQSQVSELKQAHAIYTVGSGRINIAGLNSTNIERVASAIVAVLA